MKFPRVLLKRNICSFSKEREQMMIEKTNKINNLLNKVDEFLDDYHELTKFLDAFVKDYFASRNKQNLDTLLRVYQKAMFAKIKEKETKGKTFIGGKFKISLATDSTFSIEYDLYFQDAQTQKYQKICGKQENLSLEVLTEESAKELRDEKEIVYNIDEEKPSSSTS